MRAVSRDKIARLLPIAVAASLLILGFPPPPPPPPAPPKLCLRLTSSQLRRLLKIAFLLATLVIIN